MTNLMTGCPKCYGPGSDQGSCWNKQNPTMWVCMHCFRAVPMDDVWFPAKVLAALLAGLAFAVCYAGLA